MMGFPPEERLIFGPYWNGASQVYADPLAVKRCLVQALGGRFAQTLRESLSEDDTTAFAAIERLLAASRLAFGMAPFDPVTGAGALEKDCKQVLDVFLDWEDEKKKPAPIGPTCSAPTAPASCPAA